MSRGVGAELLLKGGRSEVMDVWTMAIGIGIAVQVYRYREGTSPAMGGLVHGPWCDRFALS